MYLPWICCISEGYKCHHPSTKKCMVSRDVTFFEEVPFFSSKKTSLKGRMLVNVFCVHCMFHNPLHFSFLIMVVVLRMLVIMVVIIRMLVFKERRLKLSIQGKEKKRSGTKTRNKTSFYLKLPVKRPLWILIPEQVLFLP